MSNSNSELNPLPSGWTQHVAPSGHYYYYHAESKRSTYQRPTDLNLVNESVDLVKDEKNILESSEVDTGEISTHLDLSQVPTIPTGPKNNHKSNPPQKRKRDKKKDLKSIDPPQFKISINYGPWYMIILKSGRWFVYNSKLNESNWDIPEDVMKKIEEMDRDELILLIAKARGFNSEESITSNELMKKERDVAKKESVKVEKPNVVEAVVDEDVEEKVVEEVGDEEEEEEEEEEDEVEEEEEEEIDGSLGEGFEFNWDEDIQDEEGPTHELNYQEKLSLFHEMLDKSNINPYGNWDVELNKVINEDAYDLFDSGSSRLDAFDKWAAIKIKQSKIDEEAENGNHSDVEEDDKDLHAILQSRIQESPVGQFLAFVRQKYKPKYFYIDFKRKYRDNPSFESSELTDKEKERIYREYSSYKKKDEQDQLQIVKDFLNLKIKPGITTSQLPDSIFDDTKFYIQNDKIEDIIKDILSTNNSNEKVPSDTSIHQKYEQYRKAKSNQQYEISRERRKLQREQEKIYDATYNLDRNSYKNILKKQ